MHLDGPDIREIVAILRPLMKSEGDRRAVLQLHLSGEAVLDRIDYSYTGQTFLVNLVSELNDHGLSRDGETPVLWKLLDGVKSDLGLDKRERIERLMGLHNIQTNARPGREREVAERPRKEDRRPDTVRGMLVLNAELKDLTTEQIGAIMERITEVAGGDQITLLEVQQGSVKLLIQGTEESIARLQELIKTEQLSELENVQVKEVVSTQATDDPQAVILLHGIRTTAVWQNALAHALDRIGKVKIIPIRYGYFDIFRFLAPSFFGFRNGPALQAARAVRTLLRTYEGWRVSIIAHSFGTYVASRMLIDNPDIRLSRLILCGAVLPQDFPWDRIESQIDEPVLNEVATRDILPILAKLGSWGYGASGTFGFGSVNVIDRFHDFGHSGFLTEEFARQYWFDWIRYGALRSSDWDRQRPTTRYWISLLSIFPLKTFVAGAVLLSALLYFGS